MTRNQIIGIQTTIGAEPDGFWGQKSMAACRAYFDGLIASRHKVEGGNKVPRPDDASMRAYYGEPCDDGNLVKIDVSGLGICYGNKPIQSISCHRRCAESLLGALTDIANSQWRSILNYYAGVYNPRKMRGGSRYSKHAWGAAIDLDPDNNGLRQHWPTSADMPFGICEIFATWGWTPAAVYWSRDAMHFERTNPL